MHWRLYTAIILLILVLTFVLQNTEQVRFSLLFWQFGLPRALLLLVVFLVGVVTGLLLVLGRRHPRRASPAMDNSNKRKDAKEKGTQNGSDQG